QDFPKDFVSPINIPIELVGNFAELRKNHFHTGIDIRTNQVEGIPIISIQNGYVSRINISSVGYGNALYIDHPNGYTSVYAHLQQFNNKIKDFIVKKQYELKQNEIDFYPKKNDLIVLKGDTIGLSGNSGGSQGPHLHFEIRDTKTENALNPFLFNFNVKDSKNPLFNEIYIYPITGKINGSENKFLLPHSKKEIKGFGSFGIGIKTYDKHDALENLNGIYSIKVYSNNELIFNFKANEISFKRPRLINSITDYNANINEGSWIYKCFKSNGNDLKLIYKTINNGIIELEKEKTKKIKIEVTDFANNITFKEFSVSGMEKELVVSKEKNQFKTDTQFLKYNEESKIKTENIEIIFPKGVFDDDLNFELTELEDGYKLHNYNFPALDYFTINAKPKLENLTNINKVVFVRHFKNGGTPKTEYITGKVIKDRLVGNFRDFGVYKFKVDDDLPVIKNKKKNNNKVTNKLQFTLFDTISGIQNYEAFIDDKWILCVFDKKFNSLTINLDDSILVGKHKIIVKATDKVNNLNEISFDFEKL
ncbi:MAG: M23 family metallopeptidase, partial [Solirubrobacteraceae bacterium]